MKSGLASLVVVAVLGTVLWFVFGERPKAGCTANESGSTLYLNRMNVETTRAQFCYASDCRLVAEQMMKAERANWYCR